jgi:uncharacterized membrane protein
MQTAFTPLWRGDAYVLWVVGLIVVCFTLVQLARAGGPKLQLPRLTGAHLSTLVAWLIIAISVLIALSRRR